MANEAKAPLTKKREMSPVLETILAATILAAFWMSQQYLLQSVFVSRKNGAVPTASLGKSKMSSKFFALENGLVGYLIRLTRVTLFS